MSQEAVERVIGKLVTDEEFRERFARAPDLASRNAGLQLSGVEIEALSRIPASAITRLSAQVDDRIRRLPIGTEPPEASPVEPGR